MNLVLCCNYRGIVFYFFFFKGDLFTLYYIEVLLMCLLDFVFFKDRLFSYIDCFFLKRDMFRWKVGSIRWELVFFIYGYGIVV